MKLARYALLTVGTGLLIAGFFVNAMHGNYAWFVYDVGVFVQCAVAFRLIR